MDEKATLQLQLRLHRADLLSTLEGLSEYDARRPLVPTGSNLAGLVKHVALVQLGYLGASFGRPSEHDRPFDEDEPDADLWLADGESVADVVALYEASAAHADATVEALPLDAGGSVPWWPVERREVTLHQLLVRVCLEVARHAGHADVLRELLDGRAGQRPGDPDVPVRTPEQWAEYCARIEAAARGGSV